MTDIVPYTGNGHLVRDTVDGWAAQLPAVGDLAQRIAATDFAPAALRGKPAAVAACILAGRELGIGPMQSLSQIHIVEGRPAPSAELMRALVFAHGHEIRYLEMNNTRAIVTGRRHGEEEWTEVTWTIDDAKRAGLDGKPNWRKYPRRMLAARATAELARLAFADVVGGMPYSSEEMEDDAGDDTDVTQSVAVAKPARRTAKRGVPKEPERSVTIATRAETQAAPLDDVPPPPLPGEDEPDQLGVTRAQLSMMHATFNEFGITNRAERLNITRSLLSLDNLTTANELTREDASTLIDMLAECQRSDDPVAALTALAAIGQPVDDDPEPDPEPAA